MYFDVFWNFVYFVLLGGVFGAFRFRFGPRFSKKAVEGGDYELCKFHVKDSFMKDPLKVVINAKEPFVILLRKESQ